jgi:hypothetical protein
MSKQRILRAFGRYAFGETSFEQFEEWIVSHLQDVLNSGDPESIALMDEADSSLIELNQNQISEEEFMSRIASKIREAETLNLTLTPDIALSSTQSDLGESISRLANFTGLSQVRLSHVFELK